jgi:arsenate reductase
MSRRSILFLCTGNSCRSQMAEGLMRHLGADRFDAYSAGTSPAGYVHPLAVAALSEAGIDISGQTSKGLDEFAGRTFDYVVTVCGEAQETCPNLAGLNATLHWPMEDPALLADQGQAGRVAARHVREKLTDKILALLAATAG